MTYFSHSSWGYNLQWTYSSSRENIWLHFQIYKWLPCIISTLFIHCYKKLSCVTSVTTFWYRGPGDWEMTYWFYAKNSFKFLRPFCVKKGILCHYSLTSAHYLLSFQVLCSFKVSAGSGAIWIARHAKKNQRTIANKWPIEYTFRKKKWQNSSAACGCLSKEYTLRAEEERQTFDNSKENDRQGLEKL